MKMTVLLYDYCELEERTSKHLRLWKAWHAIIYFLAATLGIMNYTFLQNTKDLVDDNCVFYPRKLEFHWVQRTNYTDVETTDQLNLTDVTGNDTIKSITNASTKNEDNIGNINLNDNKYSTDDKTTDFNTKAVSNSTEDAQNVTARDDEGDKGRVRRNAQEFTESSNVTTLESRNATFLYGNTTHRRVLDTTRTLFAKDSECQFAEYMPLLATVFAFVWATLFIVCPGGGRSRSGLQQPWRILVPALVFSVVMVGLTGHSFVKTNGGLQAFCTAFYNNTNATTCSSVDQLIEDAWNTTWGMGGRISATRAASAGVWALWAVAAAVLLARCLAAPDFAVRKTGVFLVDPKQKIIPHLRKSPRHSQRSTNSSPNKRDVASVKSEPTITTELVTASIEHEPKSEPTSLYVSPIKLETSPNKKDREEAIEMTYSPRELDEHR
ncbi:uncharacterized protein LOC113226532 isoform X1 [Hyposmocoma kahamanoa]|uniref:uncharacterized protein LOC113226532 isoform X1 n=1 Tax=Hyposmocoma kahamanoa TaxID=1477025 RepID=UPI000E6D93AC|nr:uncharacterized protein LOC113226532 isoform X1 [Hyposmocoma kahamanoa]XP_026314969.1 uncharacterized protein LOC113226532 isoform X1 [Hyposmocoma kahamanoa]